MLPVMVMNVMPTATQPMNEIALSSELMLSGEVKPGVLSAKIAIAPPATMRTASTKLPGRARRRGEIGSAMKRRSCRGDRVGDVGQHAMHISIPALVGGDLPAAIHADDHRRPCRAPLRGRTTP